MRLRLSKVASGDDIPILPLRPGRTERRSHDYFRHGTTSLFAALDVGSGRVIGSLKPRYRNREFLSFLRQIEKSVPEDLEVHLIVDNYSTHKTALSPAGSRLALIGICTLSQPTRAGSIKWNVSSPC